MRRVNGKVMNELKKRTITLVCTFALFVAFQGCGRKGAPKPPELTAPAPVKYLTVAPQASGIEIRWAAPTENASGAKLKSLTSFAVKRGDVAIGRTTDFETIGVVSVDAPTTLSNVSEGNIAPGAFGKAEDAAKGISAPQGGISLLGAKKPQKVKQFVYRDTNLKPGKKYDYVVVGVDADDIEGATERVLRVSFAGETSVVENLPPPKE